MPSSSEAATGRYSPTYVSQQNYNRLPRPSVSTTNIDELTEIPSITKSASTGNLTKRLIIGGLVASAFLAICASVIAPVVVSKLATSKTTVASSSTSSLANNSSATTVGSSGSNSTTVSTSSVSAGASTTASTASGASTTVSTASGASTTTGGTSGSSTTTLAAGFSAGGAVAAGTTAYYGYEEVTVNCTANLNNVTVIIYVQKTVNATYSGAFSTFWGGTVTQAYVDTGTQIIYTWTIVSGQTIQSSGSPYRAQAQFSLFGTNQTTSADTYTVRATTAGGVTSSFSGHF